LTGAQNAHKTFLAYVSVSAGSFRYKASTLLHLLSPFTVCVCVCASVYVHMYMSRLYPTSSQRLCQLSFVAVFFAYCYFCSCCLSVYFAFLPLLHYYFLNMLLLVLSCCILLCCSLYLFSFCVITLVHNPFASAFR